MTFNDMKNALKVWGIIKLVRRFSMAVIPGKVTNIGWWIGAIGVILLVVSKVIKGESPTADEWQQVLAIIGTIIGGAGALTISAGLGRKSARIEEKLDEKL
jgi:hypothetical protein